MKKQVAMPDMVEFKAKVIKGSQLTNYVMIKVRVSNESIMILCLQGPKNIVTNIKQSVKKSMRNYKYTILNQSVNTLLSEYEEPKRKW